MGFLDHDVEIRKIIRSANTIESLNAHYRRAVRARGHFPTEQATLKCLYLVTRSLDRPDAARHAGSPAASITTATICARLSPAPAARRSADTRPTVTPPTNRRLKDLQPQVLTIAPVQRAGDEIEALERSLSVGQCPLVCTARR